MTARAASPPRRAAANSAGASHRPAPPPVAPGAVVGEEGGEGEGRRHEGVAVRRPAQDPPARVVDGVEEEGEVRDPGRVEAAVEGGEHRQQRGEPQHGLRVGQERRAGPQPVVDDVGQGRERPPERHAEIGGHPPSEDTLLEEHGALRGIAGDEGEQVEGRVVERGHAESRVDSGEVHVVVAHRPDAEAGRDEHEREQDGGGWQPPTTEEQGGAADQAAHDGPDSTATGVVSGEGPVGAGEWGRAAEPRAGGVVKYKQGRPCPGPRSEDP